MNHIILFENDFISDNRVIIKDRRFIHTTSIIQPSTGDTLKVGLINGKLGIGTVISFSETSLHLEISLDKDPPPALPASLVIALPRPKIVRRLVQCVTAMGVKRIAFIRTWKVEKSYWQSPVLKPDSLYQDIILGLEQAGDTIVPEITQHGLFKPFVEDVLPSISKGTLAVTAHPGGASPCPHAVEGPSTIAIGPEAGFIPYEVSLLEQHGFSTVNLGDRILRVDQAVPAILGRMYV